MTMPSGGAPPGALAPGGFAAWQAMTEADAKTMMAGGTKGAFGGAQNAFKTNGIPLSQQLLIINDHTAQISEIRETVEAQILQGLAITFISSGWWNPPRTLVYADLIGIGAGAGGAGGTWNLTNVNRKGGGAGGGGGEIHFRIYAAFLPKTGDDFDPIRVDMYLAGNGGTGGNSPGPGGGGGNIIFGANLSTPIVTFQGGVGGLTNGTGGLGGYGMIPGGKGGNGGSIDGDAVKTHAEPGGSSSSAYSFSGGGGGGGGGDIEGNGTPGSGGNGVASAGGTNGAAGQSPNPIIAAGAGGGAGANGGNGGAGGFPAGGGGGGYGGRLSSTSGGKGGEAKLYVVETKNSA